jgi:4-hydroxy-3-polyprenylbenzoate decarboxylase
MKSTSLRDFISLLESKNELVRIDEFVNPELEMSEFSDRMMKLQGGGKALLFTNTGTDFPVLINHYGSEARLFAALNIASWDEPGERIDNLLQKMMKPHDGVFAKLSVLTELKNASGWMPVKRSGRGKCQEIIVENPDLNKLPILKCWPHDGGKFFTLPMVISVDPDTGLRNTGMYRMQVFDSNTTGMHWHLHKGGAAHFQKYKKLKKKMPISVVLGGDPVLTYCATAPLPPDIDEFLLAGFLTNRKTELVKSLTNDIYVPATADFVIEGFIDPEEEFVTEGPFGDHTGFYSLADNYPKFHITCITHRKDAVYPATLVGIPPMEDFYLGKATERIFLKPVQIAIAPEILDIRLPSYGVAHNLVLVKAKINYPGQSIKIMNALLGAGQMMFSKVIICFNESINIQNDKEVANAILGLENLYKNLVVTAGPSDVLDHSSYKFTFGGKLLIDATSAVPTGKSNDELIKNIQVIAYDNLSQIDQQKGIFIVVDEPEAIRDNQTLAWLVLSNIDPAHDIKTAENVIIIDARSKNMAVNNFSRDWPNPVSMDEKTIKTVDEKWTSYTGMDFVESPSLKYKLLVKGNSAIYNQGESFDGNKI